MFTAKFGSTTSVHGRRLMLGGNIPGRIKLNVL
jgi:hypothetical protein